MAVLVNERKPPGIYQVEFSASSCASRVYYYRLVAGSFADTKKALLVR